MYEVGPLILNKWKQLNKILEYNLFGLRYISKSTVVHILTRRTVQVNYLIFCKSIFLVCQLVVPRFLVVNCRVDRWWGLLLVQLFFIVIKHSVIISFINDIMTFINSPIMAIFTVTVMKFCHSVADLQLIRSCNAIKMIFQSGVSPAGGGQTS